MNILNYLVVFAMARLPIKRQRGATMVEYALIVGLISIAAIIILPRIAPHIESIFRSVNQGLNKAS